MNILFAADINSAHTKKWAEALSERNHRVTIFSFTTLTSEVYSDKIKIIVPKYPKWALQTDSKLKYMTLLPQLKKVIKELNPDILHAHYASSYGFLASLTNFHPFVVSVWGSDIMSFPSNKLKKGIVKSVLNKADSILATSNYLKEQTKEFTSKYIQVIPFGVKKSDAIPRNNFNNINKIVFGTVKNIKPIYGHKNAFILIDKLAERFPDIEFSYEIAGEGDYQVELQECYKKSKYRFNLNFNGYIPNDKLKSFYNKIDFALYLSERESFGVSILESSAAGIPVITSNIPPFHEVVINNKTGIRIIDTASEESITKIASIIENIQNYCTMSLNGIEFVNTKYSLEMGIIDMEKNYNLLVYTLNFLI